VQVVRRRAVKPPPVDDKWRITRELAAVRAASQIVVGHHQQLAATFKMVKIYTLDNSGWREARDATSSNLRTDLKVFLAGLAAETLFAEQPPIEHRAHDFWHIRNCASCVKYFFPKMRLAEIVERALPDVFGALVSEHLSVARIARALLKRERLNGEEIRRLLEHEEA
jgi:hypothetical protein